MSIMTRFSAFLVNPSGCVLIQKRVLVFDASFDSCSAQNERTESRLHQGNGSQRVMGISKNANSKKTREMPERKMLSVHELIYLFHH